jgi:histidyl-tRNA synthetase
LDEPRARTVLTVVDRYEKHGDAAFTAYTEAFGPLPEDLKARILAFLGVKSLPALEAMLAPLGGDKLAARLAEWRQVLSALDAMGLGSFVTVDLGVVRGLAYYTGFVFEAFDRRGDLRALAGGGRYDDLVKKLGGPDLPAVGFAIGDMTFSLLLEQRGLLPPLVSAPDVYCVIGGAAERLAAFREIHALRAAGFRVEYPLRDLAFGKQFKAAAESGARLALILGGDELARGVVKVRDLGQRSEVEVPRDAVVAHVRDFLAGNG